MIRQLTWIMQKYRAMVTFGGLGLLLVLAASVSTTGQNKPTSAIACSTPRPSEKLNKSAADVRSIIQSGRLADLQWQMFSDVRPDVDGFYRSSDLSRKVARKSEVPPFLPSPNSSNPTPHLGAILIAPFSGHSNHDGDIYPSAFGARFGNGRSGHRRVRGDAGCDSRHYCGRHSHDWIER